MNTNSQSSLPSVEETIKQHEETNLSVNKTTERTLEEVLSQTIDSTGEPYSHRVHKCINFERIIDKVSSYY